MIDELYYKESGRVGIPGIIMMPLAGILSSLLLGVVYGYAIYYIPFIYLNFFITAFYGGIVGVLVGKAGYLGKVRNTKVILIMGVLFGVVAEYIGWTFWIHALSEQELLIFDPGEMFLIISELADGGIWSIFGWTPTGGALYAIWVIEALIIIICATLAALYGRGDQPFCEACEKWSDSKILTNKLEPINNPDGFKQAMEKGNFEELTNLKNVGLEDLRRSKVELFTCSNCRDLHHMSVYQITVSVDEKGKADEDEQAIVENLIISRSHTEEFKKWGENLNTSLTQPEPESESE